MKTCTWWKAGNCRQGAQCWFLHREVGTGEACSAPKAKAKAKTKAKTKAKNKTKAKGALAMLGEEGEEAHGFPALDNAGLDQSGADEAEEEEEEEEDDQTGGWIHPQDWEEEYPEDYDETGYAGDYDYDSWQTDVWWTDESAEWGESPWEQSGSW